MSLASLDDTHKRVLMFGGKGGVGKTTSSAATALHFTQAGRKTLIISSDLAPSLSDIFEMEIGPKEREVKDVTGLFALEIDPDEVMRRWKEKFGPEVYEAAAVLVDMPYDEFVAYAAMAPGIQEEFLLDYILEQVQGGYDAVVWDTAPAGDTLRLLGLPGRFIEHLRLAPKVYLGVRDRLGLAKAPFLEIIESWKELASKVMGFFGDPQNVGFIMVTIPEALGVYQSRRVTKELEEYGLQIEHLIINDVVVEPECEFHRRRWEMQQPYIKMIVDEYGERMTVTRLPLLPYEVKGVERLKEVERLLFAEGGAGGVV